MSKSWETWKGGGTVRLGELKGRMAVNAVWDPGTNDIGGNTGEIHMRFSLFNSIVRSVLLLIIGTENVKHPGESG